MAAKKSFTKQNIIKAYMQFVLEEGNSPKNVYAFAHSNGAQEAEFYKHFSSFETLEKEIFLQFFTETIKLLKKDEEYADFSPKDKLLSFYFTFFAILTKNRSYVLHALKKDLNKLNTLRMLGSLKTHYIQFVKTLGLPQVDLKLEKLEKLKEKGMEEMSFNQLLFTLKFWMEDSSANFEKTDIFIEKSINTGFEVIESSPLQSIVDLGKFLYKEKVSVNA